MSSTTVESWFIPFDILFIANSVLIIVISLFSLTLIVLEKACRNVSTMLIAHTYVTAIILGCLLLGNSIFALENDLAQQVNDHPLCIIRGFIDYGIYTLFNCSFVSQALHRYVIVVHPNRLFWKSYSSQLLLIGLTCVHGVVYLVPFVFIGDIVYNSDNQICQIVLRLSFSIIYGAFFAYTLPLSLVVYIYVRLVRYVKEMGRNAAAYPNLFRAKRELRMVRRLVLLLAVLIGIAFPYILIMFMAFFNQAPRYHFRLAYIFLHASASTVLVLLFQFTEPLKASLVRRMKSISNEVIPSTT